jgi:hypothetical protein
VTIVVIIVLVWLVVVSGLVVLFKLWLREDPKETPEPSWWATAQRRQVLLHTTDDKTLRGLVQLVTDEGVLVAAPEWLDDSGVALPLAGEAFIPHERVRFVQLPPQKAP